ncbi:hypothetical protein GCM10010399_60100 [Dactylosporangium fulvum]|uniref:Uncharacterized protein n=1 Tax=Dactylosporangium fulvum TaxID=53359 RepID=A0ABY5VQH5_9ACTN|nr:hypothetical protein [Dactylosporangium fulvum]UWP80027.1 hypothetical protein Dfulv_33350 [Dactylosporangium fulvum]
MALRRLGWASTPPVNVVVSDRVRRMAEEHAARLLRLALHRDALLRAVVTSWPDNPQRRTDAECKALWAAGPEAMTKVEARNRTRQVAGFLAARGRLPVSIAQAEAPPYTSGQILTATTARLGTDRAGRARVTTAASPSSSTRPAPRRNSSACAPSGRRPEPASTTTTASSPTAKTPR